MQEVSGVMEWCGHHGPGCVVLVALFVDGVKSKFIGEWASTGWCCCGCVLTPHLPFSQLMQPLQWT